MLEHLVRSERHELAAEARLLERIARLETELDMMTVELVASQDQLLALYDLSRSTRSHLGLNETLRTVAVETARLTKAKTAALYMPPLLVWSDNGAGYHAALLPVITAALAQQRELLLSPQDPGCPVGVNGLCCVPVTIRGATQAMLVMIDKPDGAFGAPDLKLAHAISEHAGAQIEHALLHHETLERIRLQTEVDLAYTVQTKLLPQQLPQLAGIECFARSQAARQVGGDFYDLIDKGNQQLCFMIGDVAGKGLAAALVMAMIHSTASSATRFMPGATPAKIMQRTNSNLYDDLTNLQRFATAFVGQCDPVAGWLRYANAGHSPVIYCPAGGTAQLLEADGAPLGVLLDTMCADWEIPFHPGDVLVMATDGFSEAQALDGELFGYDRLLDLVTAHAAEPAAMLGDTLFAAIARHEIGHQQDDDQTLLIIKRRSE